MFGKKPNLSPKDPTTSAPQRGSDIFTPGFSRFFGTDAYITSAPLEQAVNAAIALERPLLITGEPGTCKTMLAEEIAKSLGLDLLRWQIKSTTRAADGLYVYDTVQRLHDSRFDDADVSDIGHYIRFGSLGQSFQTEKQVVLLIDEVDKADIEFPNDLLHELDAMSFDVLETQEHITAQKRPIVVITSNNEKELPDAFLRRCVFHYIAFPDKAMMAQIIKVHFPDIEETLLDDAIATFYALREVHGLRKRPSTSELLDWISALRRSGIDTSKLSLKAPFLGTLIKNERDMESVDTAASKIKRR